MYKYFISYTHGSNDGKFGFGNCDITLDHSIEGVKDTITLETQILQDVLNNQKIQLSWVKIINFIEIK